MTDAPRKASEKEPRTMPSMVAVLDTNFWLSTHVTTVTIGYAAGLLAGAVAHVYLLGKLFDAIPFGGMGLDNPMEMLDELDGFPVRAVEFENGKAVRETILESSRDEAIDADMFDLPPDYSRIDPLAP